MEFVRQECIHTEFKNSCQTEQGFPPQEHLKKPFYYSHLLNFGKWLCILCPNTRPGVGSFVRAEAGWLSKGCGRNIRSRGKYHMVRDPDRGQGGQMHIVMTINYLKYFVFQFSYSIMCFVISSYLCTSLLFAHTHLYSPLLPFS